MKKNILITGVSTGIGEAIAQACLNYGHRVFGTVRNQKDREKCEKKWKENFTPLLMDVTKSQSVSECFDLVKEQMNEGRLDILINNSGIARPGPLELQPMEELREIFEVNVFGLLHVTRTFLPLLKRAGDPSSVPKIINISSVSGRIAFPFLGGYAGSKHAVEGLSHSLRRELMPYGIQVVIIAPGAVKTPIWKKAEAENRYPGTLYNSSMEALAKFARKSDEKGLEPEKIGRLALSIIQAKNPRTRYAPTRKKLVSWHLPLWMPTKVLDRGMFKMLKMKMQH